MMTSDNQNANNVTSLFAGSAAVTAVAFRLHHFITNIHDDDHGSDM